MNGALDVMFNLDAQVANNVPGDNGGIRGCDKERDGDSEKDSGGHQWHGIIQEAACATRRKA